MGDAADAIQAKPVNENDNDNHNGIKHQHLLAHNIALARASGAGVGKINKNRENIENL